MELAAPYVTIDPEPKQDIWMPRGLLEPLEARFDRTLRFVPQATQKLLIDWWLKVKGSANTPNWDIVSTCTIEGKLGLLLVEAKAHAKEMGTGGKPREGNEANHAQIGIAIQEANTGLNEIMPGWALQRDACYQLSNRFAWAWKLASFGIPVVLVYLGFRNAAEMESRGPTFATQQDWEMCVKAHAKGIVPEEAWGSRLDIEGTPLIPLLRSLELRFIDTPDFVALPPTRTS